MESIESAIVKGLLYDEDYARKIQPFLNDTYFEGASKEVYNIYAGLFEKYNKIPTMEAMLISIQNSKMQENTFAEACQILEDAYKERKNLSDTKWLIDETESYCMSKSLHNAIYQSISIIEGNDKKLDLHAIPTLLEEALSVSFQTSIGSDYLEDFQKRFDYYTNTEARLHFPLKALEKLSNGGLPPKTLSCALATTNTGKSALMCYLAGEWLKEGKNVLYITMEMSEEAVQERIDANLLDIKTNDLKNPNLDRNWFEGKIAALKGKTLGRLMVKEYPTGSAHSGHFRHLLKEYRLKKKFVPDIIFIDYINICASSRYKSMSGVNSYSYIKAIAEELRGLAVEHNLPIFTATQTNREASNSAAPDMSATSESFGLPMSLDFFFAITTSQELLEAGRQVFHLLKTRFGNKQGVKAVAVGIDFDKMRYSDIEGSQQEDTVKPSEVGNRKPSRTQSNGIPEDISWD